MKLEEYFGSYLPGYAILSHCWGTEEVTFVDINGPSWRGMLGATKIEYASSHCRDDGLNYIWIDTCCIDKSSSAELSEAINSMYDWYAKSQVCYAYLEDINSCRDRNYSDALRKSRWFTRGWTLQELVAPKRIKFFNKHWIFLGEKALLLTLLSAITTIPEDVLADPAQRLLCSVARKMSWAASRQTTREEDMSYCLLGIFDVRMPLLYGEGNKAFVRLQEEILKETDDQTLFAWGLQRQIWDYNTQVGVLAVHPWEFAGSESVVPFPSKLDRQPHSMTNKGLRIELPVLTHVTSLNRPVPVAILNCHYENDFSGAIGMALGGEAINSVFTRLSEGTGEKFSPEQLAEAEVRTIYIAKQSAKLHEFWARKCLIRSHSAEDWGYKIIQVGPKRFKWNPATMVQDMSLKYAQKSQRSSLVSHFVFSSHTTNNCFAINLGVDGPLVPPHGLKVWRFSIRIVLKPEGIGMKTWLEECNKAIIDWSMDAKIYDSLQLPHELGEENGLIVSATVAEEEILNQKIIVLDVEMKDQWSSLSLGLCRL